MKKNLIFKFRNSGTLDILDILGTLDILDTLGTLDILGILGTLGILGNLGTLGICFFRHLHYVEENLVSNCNRHDR
jgi:hypothetical protein